MLRPVLTRLPLYNGGRNVWNSGDGLRQPEATPKSGQIEERTGDAAPCHDVRDVPAQAAHPALWKASRAKVKIRVRWRGHTDVAVMASMNSRGITPPCRKTLTTSCTGRSYWPRRCLGTGSASAVVMIDAFARCRLKNCWAARSL